MKRVLHLSDNLVCFSANALYLWQNYAVDFVVLFVTPWNIKEKTNIWHLTHGRGLLLNFIPVKLLYPWADRISSGNEEALYLPFLFNLFIHCKSKLSIVWERGSRREKLCSISSDKNYKWSFWKTETKIFWPSGDFKHKVVLLQTLQANDEWWTIIVF